MLIPVALQRIHERFPECVVRLFLPVTVPKRCHQLRCSAAPFDQATSHGETTAVVPGRYVRGILLSRNVADGIDRGNEHALDLLATALLRPYRRACGYFSYVAVRDGANFLW